MIFLICYLVINQNGDESSDDLPELDSKIKYLNELFDSKIQNRKTITNPTLGEIFLITRNCEKFEMVNDELKNLNFEYNIFTTLHDYDINHIKNNSKYKNIFFNKIFSKPNSKKTIKIFNHLCIWSYALYNDIKTITVIEEDFYRQTNKEIILETIEKMKTEKYKIVFWNSYDTISSYTIKLSAIKKLINNEFSNPLIETMNKKYIIENIKSFELG
jgi:hypothetical protein